MSEPGKLHIGTSGWHYAHWKGPFYPDDLADREMLAFYAARFRAAEINNSFYQLPDAATLRDWGDSVPEHFVFCAKASRYLTHMKKLKDPHEPLSRFLDRIRQLGTRLGPVLFQLPPRWHCNPERLEAFLALLPQDLRFAFEFRDESWFNGDVYDLLSGAGAAFCIYDLAGRQAPTEVTAEFVYLRLHGPGEAYQGSYDRQTLGGWAGALSSWRRAGRDVYCFFDNDQKAYAVHNALQLQEMLEGGD